MSSQEQEQEYGCPNCGATDGQVQQDVVMADAKISGFRRNEDGELVPEWAGDTEILWNTQAPDFREEVPRFRCGYCDQGYDEPDEIVEPEQV